MNRRSKNFIARARSWITKNHLHGPHAFLRFVMLVFVERLNQTSDEFIFKGGNLLWVYIKTPRSTIDIDFVTRTLGSHDAVQKALEAVCYEADDSIIFSIKSFQPVETKGALGASVTIAYRTAEGQSNSFDLDIVYAIPTTTARIPSPLKEDEMIFAATLENIVSDKLSAAQQYRSGNSRMKDFDDLWRISRVKEPLIDWQILKDILHKRSIQPSLNPEWITSQMQRSWQSHVKRNKGLPLSLEEVMEEVNQWLREGLGN